VKNERARQGLFPLDDGVYAPQYRSAEMYVDRKHGERYPCAENTGEGDGTHHPNQIEQI
jgi:uncharacterized protein YigE (DUF2233 family)